MRKSVIIPGIITVLVTIYVLFIMPLSDKRDSIKENMETKYSMLKKYEAIVNGSLITEGELKDQKAILYDLETGILNSPVKIANSPAITNTPSPLGAPPSVESSLAFARFQNGIQDMAERSGVRIVQLKPLNAIVYDGYLGLPLFIEARGDIRALSEFLHSIDRKESFIRVEKLGVSVQEGRAEKEIRIKMQVAGLLRS